MMYSTGEVITSLRQPQINRHVACSTDEMGTNQRTFCAVLDARKASLMYLYSKVHEENKEYVRSK